MEIAERLFLTHRPNKGKKLAGTKGTPKGPSLFRRGTESLKRNKKGLKRNIPQTRLQINQVRRILNPQSMRTYEYFDLII